MKKFTKLWQLMMILMLTSSVAFAQKAISTQDVAKKHAEKQAVELKQQALNGEVKLSPAEQEQLGIEVTTKKSSLFVSPDAEIDPNLSTKPLDPSDAIFDPLFNWPLTNLSGLSVGIETDGNYIYTVHWTYDTIYRYDMDGNYIGFFQLAGVSQIRDLAYNPNNGYFYGAAAGTNVWEMDFTLGAEALVSTITAPTAIRAIGFDDDNDYLFGNNWSSDVVIFDLTGTQISSFTVGPVGGSYYGFAYDNNTTGGPFIWGYAQIGNNQNQIVQMNYPSGTETGVRYDVGTQFGFTSLAGGLAVVPPGTFNDPPVPAGTWTLFGISQNEAMWGIDLDPNPCYHPVDLDATNITQTTADLSWTEAGSATSWDIEFGTAGFVPTGTPTYTGVTNPYTVTGLTGMTAYDFYVRSDCGGGDYSVWSGPFTFTTSGDCDWECIGYDSYGDGWNGGSVDFYVDGNLVGSWAGPAGSGPESYFFPIADPCTIDIVWNSGSYDSEVTYEIYDNFGTKVFDDGPNPTGTTGLSGYCTLSCPPPSNLATSGITDVQAVAEWDETGSAINWNLVWGYPGFDPADPAQYIGSAAVSDPFGSNPHSYTMTGLTACTAYEWYVQADCGGGSVSSFTGPVNFSTNSGGGISTFPYIQTFDAFTSSSPSFSCTADGSVILAECWTNFVGEDIDWDVISGATGSGNTGPSDDVTGGGKYLYTESSSCYGSVGTVISPEFDFSGLTVPMLTFSYHMYGAGMGTMDVEISSDGGTTWTNIWTMTGDQGNQWNTAIVSLPAYGGSSSIVFKWIGTTGTDYTSDMAFDQVEIEETPACPEPTALGATNITTTAADLSWTSNSGLSDIIWGLEGFDPTVTGTYVLGVTSPYNLTGLTEATGYDFYVRDDCGGGTVSTWAGPYTFYTIPHNDECVDADYVSGPYPQTVSGTTTGATVDCPGVLDWNAVWYEIDLPYDYNIVDIGLCLDDAAATLNNTGIILTADCSCDANSFIYSTGTWSVANNCIDSLVFMVEGPTTVYYPVLVDPAGDFTFDVNVLPMYDVSGTVTYANGASTPMDYISVFLTNPDTLQNTYTDSNGDYLFTYVDNGTYTLLSSTDKPRGGTDILDVIRTKQFLGGSYAFTPLQYDAADVNNNASVDILDAIFMQQLLGGTLNPGWTAPDWIFEDPIFTVSGSDVVVDYQALCSGDPNGSYTPPTSLPPYCDAGATTCDEFIDGIVIGSINNTGSGCGLVNGYSDYTAMSTDLTQGAVGVSITVTNGSIYGSDDLGIWIDWNQDGDFDDADENVVCDVDNGADGTFTFDVPATATLGQTKMRIRIKYFDSDCGSPCGVTTYGEVEDYTVNIIP